MAISALIEGVPCDVCGVSTDERALDFCYVSPVTGYPTCDPKNALFLCQSCAGYYDDDDLIDLFESRQDHE